MGSQFLPRGIKMSRGVFQGNQPEFTKVPRFREATRESATFWFGLPEFQSSYDEPTQLW